MEYRNVRRVVWRWVKKLFLLWFVLWLYGLVTTNPGARSTLLTFMFYGAFIIFWTGGQIFMFVWFMARTKQRLFMPGEAGLPSLSDYWGQPKLVEIVKQWVELLRGSDKFRALGGRPPTGMLLYGPPGSGKTYLAQAIAGSAGIPLFYLDASSLQSAWMGIGNIKVVTAFRKCKKLAMDWGACAIYLDEIDAVASARIMRQPRPGFLGMMMGGMGGGGSMILSTLLHELDGSVDDFLLARLRNRLYGFLGLKVPEQDWTVFTFGGTNIPEVLDPALTRSGRLSRSLKVDRPDRAGRKDILLGYLGKVKSAPDVDVERLVDELAEATPADIKTLVREEAPRKAVFEGAKEVSMKHFMSALREVQVGLKNPIQDLDPKEREKIAVHECGHALLTWLLTDKRVSTVTVVRYGDSLGHVMPTEIRQRSIHSLNELWVDAIISIGGRAAEILVYGEPLKSVGGDYPHVMQRLQDLIGAGMWGTPVGTDKETSVRIRHLFDTALTQATSVLSEHRAEHWNLVQAVLEKDELGHDDVLTILGERQRATVKNPIEPLVLKLNESEERGDT